MSLCGCTKTSGKNIELEKVIKENLGITDVHEQLYNNLKKTGCTNKKNVKMFTAYELFVNETEPCIHDIKPHLHKCKDKE